MKFYAVLRIAFYLWAYAGWFLCVLGGKAGYGFATLLVPLVSWLLLGIVLRPGASTSCRLGLLMAAGLFFDSLALRVGWIRQPNGSLVISWWLVALWLHFAPTMMALQQAFGKRLWLAAIAGAILGPLSYKAGETFEVLFLSSPFALCVYMVMWAIYLPTALYWLAPPKK